MLDHAARFVGDIPLSYEKLGPHLFCDYAADLVRRVAAAKPRCVLEIAAGTGIVTRLLRDALPQSTRLVATDLNPPMLAVAQNKFNGNGGVEFKIADATALPFADGAFDTVVCQFGVMFVPDRDRAHREAFRVLAPGGHYYFNVWDSFDFNPFARLVHETVAGFFTQAPPNFFTIPFSYHRIDLIKTSLIAAGFDDISIHLLKIEKAIPQARHFAEGLVRGNPIIQEIEVRGTARPNEIVDAVTTALQRTFGADPGRMSLQAIVFEARRGGPERQDAAIPGIGMAAEQWREGGRNQALFAAG
jgi:SAM-dependent methyltransferase